MVDPDRSCLVYNFGPGVTTATLFELFDQVGPVERVLIYNAITYSYSVVVFVDPVSVQVAMDWIDILVLDNVQLLVLPFGGSIHDPFYESEDIPDDPC
ncbi:hypothetical protein KIN20_037218 [Parelaphostrongylus tenuis]|uniref:RRM domain-containing protein n=1 Tax=Parelaphostrongylus tenuis TaxID=148309 RepID=A0AAD5RDM7_PARTN|nr:hypothetical protein KIN20_037218 [Parelaphostrongylus tenuis]